MKFEHFSVLKNECIQFLDLQEGGIVVDCTLGGGGHSEAILNATKTGRLIAVDKDNEALQFAKQRLEKFSERITFVKEDFCNTEAILKAANVEKVDGVLMDLGVSSYQLDNSERGFSYRANESLLDMRMDKEQYLTAFNVINEYNFNELVKIFFEYGEERFSKRIAENIIKFRQNQSIRTVGELNEIIEKSIPRAMQKFGHPSKRVFQAIRIEVNGELENLQPSIEKWVRALKNQGRICVITFHSLEDRIVKQTFKEFERSCVCPKRAPICVCGKQKELEILTKNVILPSEAEVKENSRSESAKLRAAKKIV